MYPGDLSAGKPDECIGCRCYLAGPEEESDEDLEKELKELEDSFPK
jgi:hypothetical protein